MEPEVTLVDLWDRPLGRMGKKVAHAKPRLHRAFSVFLQNDNKLLLQRRALEKYHTGGLWANTCCSHPRPGEAVAEAASRRLWEEAGIRHQNLRPVFSFPYFAKLGEDLYEYEYDHVLLGEYDGSFSPNPEEVAELQWVEIPALMEDMHAHPERYAPWFLICAPRLVAATYANSQ